MASDITVDDPPYNAAGDGVTDDRPAILAMAAATGGTVRFSAREYFVSNLTIPAYDFVRLEGRGMPLPDAGRTKLIGGTVLIGGVNVAAGTCYVADLGVDSGTGRGYAPGALDGLVINAPSDRPANVCHVHDVASLGPGESGSSHGVLIQGYNGGAVRDVYCAARQYGVVIKCRTFNVSDISGDAIATALVFVKSDQGAPAGGVADGSATNVNVVNVNNRCTAGNTACVALYIMGSTASVSKVTFANVTQQGGFAPVRVQGSGTLGGPAASNVTGSDVMSDGAQYGFYAGGYTYDWQARGVSATNPASGQLFAAEASATNWKVTDGSLLITDSTITATVAANAQGNIGLYDDISVRNPYRTMSIATGAGVTAGRKVGNVV